MLRYLPLFLIVLAIDLLAFPIFHYWFDAFSETTRLVTKVFYFSLPVGLILLLDGNDRFRWRKRHRVLFSNVYAGFQLLYICKVIALLALLVFFIANGLVVLASGIDLTLWKYPMATTIAAIPFVLLPYGILVNRHRYQIRRVGVSIPELDNALKGLTIVQISDIHSGSFFKKEGFERGVKMINELKPDLIFFTGDLVNNRAIEFVPFVNTFKKLKATYGIYSVLGNHDYGDYVKWRSSTDKLNNVKSLIDIQRSMGWDVLLNENRLVDVNGANISILGVENYSAKLRFPKYGKLILANEGTKSTDLQLLLSHDPSHWRHEVIPDYPSIDITFSGHTHGMQFGIKIGPWEWSPIKYIYKEWAGLYKEDNQYLYVNRGFGVLGYPGRVGILPEITLMTLE